MAEFRFRKIEPHHREGTSYEVFVDGERLGEVHSYREQSWRTLPSGVRYSLRGNPRYWTPDVGLLGRPRHCYTRAQAAQALLESVGREPHREQEEG